jgi:hypothetical protein
MEYSNPFDWNDIIIAVIFNLQQYSWLSRSAIIQTVLLLLLLFTLIQGIYDYVPDTSYVFNEYNVTAVIWLQCMVLFDVCGSVHLGNKCCYFSPTECTIFLKSLFAQHVSDVKASIIRSTTVVFHSHRFLVSGVFILCDLYWCRALSLKLAVIQWWWGPTPIQVTWNKHTRNQKSMAVKNYCCAPDDGCCDIQNMLSK